MSVSTVFPITSVKFPSEPKCWTAQLIDVVYKKPPRLPTWLALVQNNLRLIYLQLLVPHVLQYVSVCVSEGRFHCFCVCVPQPCIRPCSDKVFVSVLTCVCVGIFLFLCVPSVFFSPLCLTRFNHDRICLVGQCVQLCKGVGAAKGLRGPLTTAPAGGLSRWADPG